MPPGIGYGSAAIDAEDELLLSEAARLAKEADAYSRIANGAVFNRAGVPAFPDDLSKLMGYIQNPGSRSLTSLGVTAPSSAYDPSSMARSFAASGLPSPAVGGGQIGIPGATPALGAKSAGPPGSLANTWPLVGPKAGWNPIEGSEAANLPALLAGKAVGADAAAQFARSTPGPRDGSFTPTPGGDIAKLMADAGKGNAVQPITSMTQTADPAMSQLANMMNAVPNDAPFVNQFANAASNFARMTGGRVQPGGALWNAMTMGASPNVYEQVPDARQAAMSGIIQQFMANQGQQQLAQNDPRFQGIGNIRQINAKQALAQQLMANPATAAQGQALLLEAVEDLRNMGRPGEASLGPKPPGVPTPATEIVRDSTVPERAKQSFGALGVNVADGRVPEINEFLSAIERGFSNPTDPMTQDRLDPLSQFSLYQANPKLPNPYVFEPGTFSNNVSDERAKLMALLNSQPKVDQVQKLLAEQAAARAAAAQRQTGRTPVMGTPF